MLFWVLTAVTWLAGPQSAGTVELSAPPSLEERREIGYLPGHDFSPQETGMPAQSWCIAQRADGLIYCGHSEGLHLFDGVRWRAIVETPNVLRCLPLPDQKVLLGTATDLVLASANEAGDLWTTRSLLTGTEWEGRVRKCTGLHDFGSQGIFAAFLSGTLFSVQVDTTGRDFRATEWSPAQVESWGRLHLYDLAGEPVVFASELGLQRIVGNQIDTLLPANRLAGMYITGVVQTRIGLILATWRSGLWRFSEGSLSPFGLGPDGTSWSEVSILTRVSSDRLAVTNLDSLVLFDNDGEVIRCFSVADHLRGGAAYGAPTLDHEGGLWIPATGGVLRLDLNSRWELYDSSTGFSGIPMALERHQGQMFLGTRTGLYRSTEQPIPARGLAGSENHWELVGDIRRVIDLLSLEDQLIVATAEAIFSVRPDDDGRYVSVPFAGPTSRLALAQDGSLLAVGGAGLRRFERKGTRWQSRSYSIPFASVHRLETEQDGRLLLSGHSLEGAPKVGWLAWPLAPQPGPALSLELEEIPTQSLTGRVEALRYQGEVLLTAEEGLFAYREGSLGIQPHPIMRSLDQRPRSLVHACADSEDRLWWRGEEGTVQVLEQSGSEWVLHEPLYSADLFSTQGFFSDGKRGMWLYAADRRVVQVPGPITQASIRVIPRVQAFALEDADVRGLDHNSLADLPFGSSLHFEFSLPAYDGNGTLEFQTWLDGAEDEWTPWSREAFRDLTTLPGGSYELRVRGRDAHGRISEAQPIPFGIRSLWYQTAWAYILGVVAAGALASTFFLVRARRESRRVAKLQAEIEARRASEQALLASEAKLREEIEERARAERERESLARELRDARRLEAIGRLAGGVAHDFNNVLTAILGQAELTQMMLDNQEDPAEVSGRLKQIEFAAQRASDLVAQLLACGRQQVLRPSSVWIPQMLDDLEGMLRSVCPENVGFRIQTAEGVGSVTADPGLLEQAIINLVVNARQAMPDGGFLTIEVDEVELVAGNTYVRLAITDTGCGMDEATRERVFEPFFTTKQDQGGTGLGLASIHGFVEQSGGRLRVDSEVGKGSTFEVLLPRTEAGPNEVVTPAPNQRTLPDTTTQATILICDDDLNVRKTLEDVLQRDGHKLHTAADAEEALQRLSDDEAGIDLLITDIVLPQMSGVELARQVRSQRPDMGILLISGYSAEVQGDGSPEQPHFRLLQKPFDSKSLRAAIQDQLDGDALFS